MIASAGDPTVAVIIHTPKTPGAELTSSYENQKVALLLALDWAWAKCPTERMSYGHTRQRVRCHNADTPPRPVSLGTAVALILRTITDPPPNRPRAAMVYEHSLMKAGCIATSIRADAVLLTRLRLGLTAHL